MRNRLRNDEGWFWVTNLLVVPAALAGLAGGALCIFVAFKI